MLSVEMHVQADPAHSGSFRPLWMALALSFPFFATESLRYDNEALGLHIAFPMLVLGLLMGASLASAGLAKSRGAAPVALRRSVRSLASLAFAYLTWCLLSTYRADNFALAAKELVKILMGYLCVLTILRAFPRSARFMERFWLAALYSSVVLLAALLYRYVVVFGAPYLGTSWEVASKGGRNQLSWYVTVMTPLALSYCWSSRRWLLAGLPLSMLLISLIYIGSRGAWISTTVAVLVMAYLMARKTRSLTRSIRFAALLGGGFLLCLLLLTHLVDMTENSRRLLYIFNPEAVPELGSYETRFERVETAWELFLESPILGEGFGDTQFYAHNDYMTILADTGLVGFLLFMGMVGFYLRCIRVGQPGGTPFPGLSVGYRGMVIGVLVSMVMTNTYTMPMWWVLVGLGLVISEIEWMEPAARMKERARAEPAAA